MLLEPVEHPIRIAFITGRWPGMPSLLIPARRLFVLLQELDPESVWLLTEPMDDPFPGGRGIIHLPDRYQPGHALVRLLGYIRYQLRITGRLAMIGKQVNICVFAYGAELQPLPVLMAKALRCRVMLRTDGRPSIVRLQYGTGRHPVYRAGLRVVEWIVYSVADRILPEALYMVPLYKLDPYAAKIADGGQYIDTDSFIPSTPLAGRSYTYGYVGRLSEEKGILSFVQALPNVLGPGERVVIAGNGPLYGECAATLASQGLSDRVDLVGWVENDELPGLLNRIRTLVIPSLIEGLPNILLEGMACGCLVLAAPVGGIPAIIEPGVTGFFLQDTAAEGFARAIADLGACTDPEAVAAEGCRRVHEKYSYEAALRRYREVICGTI